MVNRIPYYLPQREHVVGMWSLEEPTGSPRRSSLNHVHLNNIYGDVLRTPGAFGSGIKCLDDENYLTTQENPDGLNITNEMTISFHLKLPSIPTSDTFQFVIAGKYSSYLEMPMNFSWSLQCGYSLYDSKFLFYLICVDTSYGLHMCSWELPPDFITNEWEHFIFLIYKYQIGEYDWLAPLLYCKPPGDQPVQYQAVGFPCEIFDIKSTIYPVKVGFVPLPIPGYVGFDCRLDELVIWNKSLIVLPEPTEIMEMFALTYPPMQSRSFII